MGDGISSSVQISSAYDPLQVGESTANWLLGGSKWGGAFGSGAALTYSFPNDPNNFSFSVYPSGSEPDSFGALSADQEAVAIAAMQSFSNVAAITFTEVEESSTLVGDIRWGNSLLPEGTLAWAYYPGDSGRAGDVWVNGRYDIAASGQGLEYFAFVHELGHALGLSHPGDNNAVPPDRNHWKYTVMSYSSYEGDSSGAFKSDYYPTTLMMDDIRVIQAIYGKNMAYRAGDTTYQWQAGSAIYETIWDGGGIDTIDASNQTAGVSINLNPGTFSTIGQAFSNGQAMVRDYLGIAYGCDIENATGSAYDDTLLGNRLANVLNGGLGADTLNGGQGADTLSGGAGNDRYYVDNTGDRVTESADSVSGGIDTVNASISYTLGSYVEKLVLTGSSAINGTGNGLNNALTGNGAANVLYGGPGADTMSGGLGNDSYHVDDAGDLVIESADSVSGGSDTVNANFTYTLGSYVERLVLTGSSAISGTGNALNNVLTGNAGSNVLSGGAGNDIFIFKTALNATSNVDTLADFSKASGNTDRIHLDDDVFTAFGSVAQSVLLSAEAFCLGTKATADSHRIVYDAQAGALYYDADGAQTGFAAVKFALLGTSTHPALTASDFTIVS